MGETITRANVTPVEIRNMEAFVMAIESFPPTKGMVDLHILLESAVLGNTRAEAESE